MNTAPYKIRITFVFFSFCLLYGVVLLNLYSIQIRQHMFFLELGTKQYSTTITTYPPRAPIFDRTGNHFLAMNTDSIALFIVPKKLHEPQKVHAFLKKHFPSAYTRLMHHRDSAFMYIARRLTPEQLQLIQEEALSDINLLKEPSRFYPVACAGAIIGITDIDNKGLFGMELQYQNYLSGQPTIRSLQKDARSGYFYFNDEIKLNGKMGEPITTSIDGNLQFLAQEELQETIETFQAQEGAVIIMNPKNGEILAMVSWPTFDPNDTTQLVLNNTKNIIVAETYELGSVIKTFAALACLEEGVVHAEELIDCENLKTTFMDGRRINTVPTSVAGIIPFTQVIEKSNNIGIAKVVKRLGPKLYEHYMRLGFGKKTGIELPGEREGFVNPPSAWSRQSYISLSYGYEISATLLQLARAFCIIANDGYAIQPTIFIAKDNPQPIASKKLYTSETIATLKTMLANTVLRGTAKNAQIKGYNIMSKTGTANLLINGVYSPTDNIYTCAGIVEKEGYQRVIITFIKQAAKKNLYASTVATPLFERIAQKMLINDRIL